MVVDPSNQTSIDNNFSCIVQCSNTELITWFINELPLPAFEHELHFRRYPKSPYCSQQYSMSNETHMLSIMALNQTFSAPLIVYCAVVTVCNKGALDCSEHTCFSENAYLEPGVYRFLFMWCCMTWYYITILNAAGESLISTSMSTIYSPASSEYNLNTGVLYK